MEGGDVFDTKGQWLHRVLGVAVPGKSDTTSSQIDGLAIWQAALAKALTTLRALEGAFRKMKEPEVDDAIILLRAIRANLTESPTTWRQIDELQRYLSEDRILEDAEEPNGFGITVSLRVPLLEALAEIQPVSER